MRHTAADREQGFTLIELLVVIIIIGILSAIAVPAFLSQRSRGYDTAAKSDLRQLAEFEEVHLNDKNAYGTIADLRSAGSDVRVSPSVTLSVIRFDGVNGFCLSARHSGSQVTWWWDSRGGGLQERTATGCPVTTTGTAGDSITG